MADCRTLKHWRPLLGFVILLSVNPLFASNLCSSVFHSEASLPALKAVAQMKFDLDIIQSRGSSLITGSQRKLQNEFPIKYAELVRGLSGRFSEPEIRRMVMTQIQELQKTRDQENREAREKAEKNKPKVNKIVQAVQFVLRERIDLPEKIFNEKTAIKYAPEAHSIFGHNEAGELVHFDIRTRTSQVLVGQSTVAFDMLANGKELVALTQDGRLTSYDVKTLKVISQKILSPIDWDLKYLHMRDATVDPTGSTMALDSAGDGIKVIDLQTGAVKTFNSSNTKLLQFAEKFQLVNKDHIVVRSTGVGSRGEVSVLDTNTGDVTVIEQVGTYGNIMLLDGGKKLVNKDSVIADIDAGFVKFHTRLTSDLSQPKQTTQRTIFNKEYYPKISPLAKGDYIFMEIQMNKDFSTTQDDAQPNYEIYHLSNLDVPAFSFYSKDRDTDADVLKHIAFAKNNKGVALYFESKMAMFPHHLEIWEPQTNTPK